MSPKDQELNMKKQTEEGNRALPLFQNLVFFVRNCFHLLKKAVAENVVIFPLYLTYTKTKPVGGAFFWEQEKGVVFFIVGL